MWYSVMEMHSRRMPCTNVTVSKLDCYCTLCYTSVLLEVIRVPLEVIH